MSYQSGSPLSLIAGGVIARGRFVNEPAAVVAASAGGEAVGVSSDDAAAIGDVIGVFPIDGQTIVEVEASAAISAGDAIAAAAGGKAATAAAGNAILGTALSAVAADGEFVDVLLQKTATLAL